jgi:hypothetical protein
VERGSAATVNEVALDESNFSSLGRAEKGQRKERVCSLESLL